MEIIFKNNEEKEVTLMFHKFLVLKVGKNKVEITPRQLGFYKDEIKKRELKIEVLEKIGSEKNANKEERETEQ